MSANILVVDDQEINRDVLEAMLKKLGYQVVSAESGLQALEKISLSTDLVLLDVSMPDMDGFQVVTQIRNHPQLFDLPIIMVTALDDRVHRLRAVEVGANDFIGKPVDMTELRTRCKSMLQMKFAQDNVKRYQNQLEKMVDERTRQLHRALNEMSLAQKQTYEAHLDTINRLVLAAEFRDGNTAVHLHHISSYSVLIAESVGLPATEQEILRIATPMHDVGKIGIPDQILLKPGRLTPQEWVVMKEHTLIGAKILADSPSELLQAGHIIALSHHEHWDGKGYPYGKKGSEIPLWGRITAIADVFDALTSERPYKRAMTMQDAIELMRSGMGTHFDPNLLMAFLDRQTEIKKIYQSYL
jgi:putative two-component system response regulator